MTHRVKEELANGCCASEAGCSAVMAVSDGYFKIVIRSIESSIY